MDPYARVPFCGKHRRHKAGCNDCKRYGAWKDRVWRRRQEQGERVTVPAAPRQSPLVPDTRAWDRAVARRRQRAAARDRATTGRAA